MDNINHKHETGIAIIVVILLLLSILLSACSTKRVVTTQTYIHDTLVVYHNDTTIIEKHITDTVVKTKTIHVADTIYRDRGQVITLNEAGDTINQHSWDNTKQHTKERESAQQSESHTDKSNQQTIRNDSVKTSQDSQQKEEKQVTKHTSSKFEIFVMVVFIFIILCLLWRAK